MTALVRLNFSIVFLYLVAISNSAFSAPAQEKFLPNAFRSDFNQEFTSITGKAKSSKGSLEYLFPGNIRVKEFKDNSEFISNEKNSWYYVPAFIKGEKGTVQVNQAGSMVLGKLFDSLHDGLVKTDFFDVSFDKNSAKLSFSKRGKTEWKIDFANLSFKNALDAKSAKMRDLEKMEISYLDKKKVTLMFFNFMDNVQYPKDYFVFKIPENTKIIR